jgi:hypothetical protein
MTATPSFDPLYVAARRTLLDALIAVRDHARSFVVVGAQAVYLRTGPLDASIAPFTTDGDLALDPRGLEAAPNLEEILRSAGFEPKVTDDGRDVIGTWTMHVTDVDESMEVDVHVPRSVSMGEGRRAARLGEHGNRVARVTDGLEAALVDYSTLTISSLDPSDRRGVEAQVAGVAALYVAKVHKIADRIEGNDRRLSDKDAGDVYRLMQVTSASDMAQVVRELLLSDVAADATARAMGLARAQFGGRATPGTELAVRNLAASIAEGQVRTLCVAFTNSLSEALA